MSFLERCNEARKNQSKSVVLSKVNKAVHVGLAVMGDAKEAVLNGAAKVVVAVDADKAMAAVGSYIDRKAEQYEKGGK